MWVGLVQSVEGLNRLKCPASRKNKEVLQQIIIRLHLHHQLSWLPTLPGSPHCRFGPVSLHNHESIPYNKSLSLHMYILLILFLWSCSVAKSCQNLCNPVDCSMPGFPVLHGLLEFVQIHVHWLSDAIHSSHLLSPISTAVNTSQHQALFQWVGASNQVANVLQFQLQHQSFQWVVRVNFF